MSTRTDKPKKPRAGKVCRAFDAYVTSERNLTDTIDDVEQCEVECRDARRHLGQVILEALDALDERAMTEFIEQNSSALESPYLSVRMDAKLTRRQLEEKTIKARDRARNDLRALANKLRR